MNMAIRTHFYALTRLRLAVVIGPVLVSLAGCEKSIRSTETLTPYSATSADAKAGQWSMIVLTGPTQVSVAAPAAVSDPGYQVELTAIESAQAAITSDQQTTVKYWASGGALRWNEEECPLQTACEHRTEGAFDPPATASGDRRNRAHEWSSVDRCRCHCCHSISVGLLAAHPLPAAVSRRCWLSGARL